MQREEMQALWQNQPAALTELTSSLVRRTASSFRWRKRAIALWEVALFLGGAAVWSAVSWVSETPLCRWGCAMMAAGNLYGVFQLLRIGWLLTQSSAADCLTFYGGNLNRWAAFRANVFWWGILPSAPGVALAWTGWVWSSPGQRWEAIAVGLFWLAMQYLIWMAETQGAARLRKEADLVEAARPSRT